jgi:hypothetical protein
MIKASKAVMIAMAGLAALYCPAVSSASAQGYYDRGSNGEQSRPDGWYDNGTRAEPYGYATCHSIISATGLGYPFGIGSRHSAIKAWQRQAWALYGHDFAWSRAETPNIDCAPYLATIRCTASARPCA